MNKITKNTTCANSKIKKSIFITQYHLQPRINQIFEILRLYCFALTALAMDKTVTQGNFLPSKTEILSMYFPTKFKNKLVRPKICENLETANSNPRFTGY